MGREARCSCRWGDRTGYVTALLESGELIVRGEISARAPLHTLERVDVRGDSLELTAAGDRVTLSLGAVSARRWAAAIATPPPTLVRKLGITSATLLHVAGSIDDDALSAACAEAANVVPMDAADLVIVRTDDRAMLENWAAHALASNIRLPPCWIVYVKGAGAQLGERGVRETMRRFSFIDTKVASVSDRLTGLRFSTTRSGVRLNGQDE